MATYYKYVERNAEDQINWAEVGKNMSDMLQQEAQAREQKKAALDKDSREYGETLSNAPSGDYDAGNTFAANYSNSQQEYRLQQDRLFQNGQLSLRDYTRNRQNGKDGTTIMFDLSKEYEAEYVDKMKRWQGDESAYEEVFKMEQAEGLANLRDVEAYINPTNGVVSIGRKVTTGTGANQTTTLSKDPNDVVTVPQLRNRIKQKVDKMKVDEFAKGAADQLGAVESAVVKYAREGSLNTILTKIDAKTGDYGVEGDSFAATYLDWETDQIEAGMRNPSDAASVLTNRALKASNGEQYTFTYETDESKRKPNEIFLDQSKNPNGVPKLSEEQNDAAIDILKTGIRAAIDTKVQAKSAGTTPYEPSASIAQGKGEDAQESVVNNFAKLFYGDQATKDDAADSIRAYNPNVEGIKLSEDGLGIVIDFTEKSGLPSETLSFGTDQKSFVESGMNFILSGDDKIADIDEVIKRGKINLSKPLLSGVDYAFDSRGDVVTSLPFEETFKQKEGSKIDAVAITDLASTTIDDDGENEAVTVVQTMVNSIPNMEDVKVRDFAAMASGRGIVVEIKGQDDLYINLDEPTKVAEQVELIREALVNHSLNNNILMDEEAKQKYVEDYGQVKKNSGSTQNAANKPAPRKN